jgi:molybdate transport system regulatory protein
MAAKRPSSQRGTAKRLRAPVLRFRMRVSDGDRIAVGPGKIALLEAIGNTGSITAAAKSLDMSYRRAWLLLDELNRSLEHPAVDSAKGGLQGGGSSLTEAGQQLITLYRRIEKRAEIACRDDIAQLMGMLVR